MSAQVISEYIPSQEDIEYVLEQEKTERLIVAIVDAKINAMRDELIYYMNHR